MVLTRRRNGAVVIAIVDITRLNGDFDTVDLGLANEPALYSPSKFRLAADCFSVVVELPGRTSGTSNRVFFVVDAVPNLSRRTKKLQQSIKV